LPDTGIFNPLLTTAQAYHDLGWSVIPLQGKVAAVPWAEYQRRKPASDLIRHWFSQSDITGIGILTGWISGLVVLDFDSQDAYTAFHNHAPDLACTRTVRTGRGWHLYYHLPPTCNLASQALPGLDIQSHGRYVVAPPSIVAGHTYVIAGQYPFRTLGQGDIDHIRQFADILAQGEGASTRQPLVSSSPSAGQPRTPPEPPPALTAARLAGLYHHLAGKRGRNNALFQAGCLARDHGWAQDQTRLILANIHIQQPPTGGHRRESADYRQREAAATIASVYTRPPGKPQRSAAVTQQLPNSVREALLSHKMTYAIRVIEGLRLKGIQPGQTFTRQEAIDLLRGIVGRDSLDKALHTALGAPLFPQLPPSEHPPAPHGAAISDVCQQQNKCYSVGAKKSGLIAYDPLLTSSDPSSAGRGGRKAGVFVMPSNAELCVLLGTTDTGGDRLTLDDLKTAPDTRKALHRELIRRRPGTYTRKWLAERLGVCLVTLDTYNRDIPINVIHAFTREKIGWHNLERVQEEKIDPSVFLADENGKKYPALRVIAASLLKKNHTVCLLAQRPSFYHYGEIPQMQFPVCEEIRPERQLTEPAPQNLSAVQEGRAGTSPPTQVQPTLPGLLLPAKMPKQPTQEQPKPIPKLSRRQLTQPLADALAEKLANDIHAWTKPDGLSLMNARKLIDTYGYTAVGKGLANLRTRVERDPDAVRSRAGLLITIIRGYWKQAHQGERTIQFEPAKPRRSRRAKQRV
jgi:hypothetical protein